VIVLARLTVLQLSASGFSLSLSGSLGSLRIMALPELLELGEWKVQTFISMSVTSIAGQRAII
jgi:hypothetical protein